MGEDLLAQQLLMVRFENRRSRESGATSRNSCLKSFNTLSTPSELTLAKVDGLCVDKWSSGKWLNGSAGV